MDNLAPNRMNLMSRRAQIRLASSGATLLRGKRNALLKDLLKYARELKNLYNDLNRLGRVAAASLAMAQAVRGTPEIESVAHTGRREMDIEVTLESVWGASVARISHSGIVRKHFERKLGYLDTSPHVFEAAESAELMLEQLLKCAPMERNLVLVGRELKNTNRRINALEEHLLPRLKHDARIIEHVLEEREREEKFRLKRIKKKKASVENDNKGK